MKQDYEIFNQKLAGYLMQRGFVLQGIRPNKDGSGRNVFLFRDTVELRQAVGDYMTM